MFAICIEASHSKGMGHLFRMLNFAKYLEEKSQEFIFLINDNEKTKEILKSNSYKYEIVNVEDTISDWETDLIKKYNFTFWINDRLDTDATHAQNIVNNRIKLITFDDLGSGAKWSDINICGLFFNQDNLKGKKVLKGVDYLILNPEIKQFKKNRTDLKNIFVSLGGSDTYGVTVNVLKLLKKYQIKATLHIGPSFNHQEELNKELTDDYKVVHFIPSLIEEFTKYDLAITGGGVTPFEANASGLPCMIIANEVFEVPNGEFLSSIGSSVFLGFHQSIDETIFKGLNKLDIKQMSQNGLSHLNIDAVEKIFEEIISYG
jgi:spore coat polysaccharide biosynthesis predicted glycosyltransferase SpsG